MVLDNTDIINKICNFSPGYYYKFLAILRKDDFKNNELPLKFTSKKEIVVNYWLVENEEQLVNNLYNMKVYSNLFNARIYLSLDRKSKNKTLIQIRNKVNNYLDQFIGTDFTPNVGVKSISKLVSSASSISESSDSKDKKILFNIDSKDLSIVHSVEYICGDEFIVTIPTVNGYHVIAKKQFIPNDRGFKNIENKFPVTLQTNAMTLIYKG